MQKLYLEINPNVIFDAGCGEGMVLNTLNSIKPIKKAFAIDIDEKEVSDAAQNLPFCIVKHGSIYNIPFEQDSFDLVICSEVLEHLERPEEGLRELHRICSAYAILSIPREPIWRFMNMVRFKYWDSFGNTPDHKNHWNTKRFIQFIDPWFEVVRIRKPLPWTILLCRKRHEINKIF